MKGWQPQRVRTARVKIRQQKAWSLFVFFLVVIAYNIAADPTAGADQVDVRDTRGAAKYQHQVAEVLP